MSEVARATRLVAVLTAVARVLGLVRWLVFAATVGAGVVGTAYGTANSVPNVLYEIAAGGALAAVVVPVVGAALAEGRRSAADQVASALLTWAVVVLLPLAGVLWLLAGPVAAALTDDAASAGLAASMLRWFAPQVPLYGIGIVATGVLQAHRRFAAAALAPVLSSVVVIAAYLLYGSTKHGTAVPGGAAVTVLAAGTTLGVVVLSLPLLLPLARAGVRLRPTLRLPGGTGARVRSLTSAGVVALVAQQAAVLATIRVANAGGGPQAAGALTVFQYGQALYLLPYAVLAVPVATAVFPALAASSSDVGVAVRRLAAALRAVLVAGGLGAAALIAASGALGRFFAAVDVAGPASGSVDVGATLTPLLRCLALGLPGYAAAAVLTRALYVRGRPRVASAWVGLGWALAAVVPVLLAAGEPSAARRLVVIGLASAAGTTVAAAGLALAVRAAWPHEALAGAGRTSVASVAATLLGAAAGAGLDAALVPVLAGLPPVPAAVAAGAAEGVVAVVVGVGALVLLDRGGVTALATRGRRSGG